MRKAVWILLALSGLGALAQTQVRISGWGGTDIAIVNGLLEGSGPAQAGQGRHPGGLRAH